MRQSGFLLRRFIFFIACWPVQPTEIWTASLSYLCSSGCSSCIAKVGFRSAKKTFHSCLGASDTFFVDFIDHAIRVIFCPSWKIIRHDGDCWSQPICWESVHSGCPASFIKSFAFEIRMPFKICVGRNHREKRENMRSGSTSTDFLVLIQSALGNQSFMNLARVELLLYILGRVFRTADWNRILKILEILCAKSSDIYIVFTPTKYFPSDSSFYYSI